MSKADDKILQEAKERYRRCEDHESYARQNWLNDVKFANADDVNGWQWDQSAWDDRHAAFQERPALTINKVRAHVLMIVNDARQNKAAIKYTPTGGDATYEAAQIMSGLARRIEYQSNATQAYDKATWDQVQGGIGYWRVTTRYADNDTMDQDIFVERVADALAIYLDPDIKEYDGSDAKFGFVENKKLTKDAEAEYPQIKGGSTTSTLGSMETDGSWQGSDYTREVEYFRVSDVADRLHVLPDGTTMKESDAQNATDALKAMAPAMPPQMDEDGEPIEAEDLSPVDMLKSVSTRSRALVGNKVEWFKIVGDKIVDRKATVFETIPIVRVIGEEFTIEGRLDRRGHVRAMRDPQRLYNYWISAGAEHVALAPKAPFVGSSQAIEGHEADWENANIENKAVLTYNGIDEAGQKIDAPQRQQPPQMPQAFLAGLQQADQQIMMVTGQYPSELGRPGNETSGVAIQQRQRQGDTATYHYIDHLATAIRYTGRLILQAAPKIYDTDRVIKIMGFDGKQSDVQVKPDMPDAHAVVPDPQGPPEPTMDGRTPSPQDQAMENVKTLWNPSIGKFAVEADVGPSFGTQREEAFNAFTQIVATNKELMNVAGDLMFKNADFPGADEMAERLRRMLPPQALGNGPSPAEAQLKQHLDMVIQQGSKMAQEADQSEAGLKQQIAQLQDQLKSKSSKDTTEDYDAETRRLNAVTAADPDAAKVLVRSMLSAMLGMPALPVIQAHQAEDALHSQALQAGWPGMPGGPMTPPNMPTPPDDPAQPQDAQQGAPQ